MQKIELKAFNDGVVRPDNRALGNFVVKTAAYTMTVYDYGDIFSNSGATGTVVFTLPAARQGAILRFYKKTQQTVTLTASGGAKIDGGSANGSISNSAAETLKTIELMSDGTDWFTRFKSGTWA